MSLLQSGRAITAVDPTAGTLNHLIALCREAEEFYGDAAEKLSGSRLRPLVSGAGASPAEGGTLAVKFRQLSGGLKAALASDTEAARVPELEDTEQTVVQSFASALGDPLDDAPKRLLAKKLELLKAHLLFWQNQPPPTSPPA